MKKCNICKEIKSFDSFSRNGKSKDGKDARCKDCLKGILKNWRIKNPHRVWLQDNSNRYLKRYGIGEKQYSEILIKQDKRCAICGSYSNGKSNKRFSIDHDHRTGNIRGLLCNSCNTGIGQLRDDIQIIQNAMDYLKRSTI